jgi:hypothetical protein
LRTLGPEMWFLVYCNVITRRNGAELNRELTLQFVAPIPVSIPTIFEILSGARAEKMGSDRHN